MLKIFFIFFLKAFFTLATSTVEKFNSGNKLFSADAYTDLAIDNYGNIVFSPYSTENILALVQSGAKNQTGEEIRSILHFPSTKEETENAMKYTVPALQGDYSTIATLNSVTVGSTVSLNEDFKDLARDIYQVNIDNVSELKKEKFVNILSLELSNGISFVNNLALYGEWAQTFQYSSTSRSPFYLADNSSVNVNMMYQISENNYYESAELDAKILELDLEEEGASLTIVLPNNIDGLSALEKKIEQVLTTTARNREVVEIYLPRFRITSTINFKGVLGDLGMKKLFDETEADLSGIGGAKGELFINDIQQQLRFDVSESAIGGSADTTINENQSSRVRRSASTSFVANHQFIFYLSVRDVIVFIGRVIEPRV